MSIARRRRGKWRDRFPLASGMLIGTLFFLTLPVTFPIAMFQHQRGLKRMRAAAETFACTQCDAVLGTQALQLADARWAEIMRQHRQEFFHARFVRDLHALCPACGAAYAYDEKRAAFVPSQRLSGDFHSIKISNKIK